MKAAERLTYLPDGFVDNRDARDLLVRQSILARTPILRKLPTMPQMKVLCGRNGGLPFDYLMTDVVSGCLPVKSICYGNCSAADFWFSQGFDFGKRVLNVLERDEFRASSLALPKEQRWLRQGWASDCSFSPKSWEMVAEAAEILAESHISLMIITKVWTVPSGHVLARFAQCGVEIRASISAFDRPSEIHTRLKTLAKARSLGAKAVPYLMTARFLDGRLATNQQAIVEWIRANDFIAAEHPLRFNSDNRILPLLEPGGFWHPKFPDQYWFGRLFSRVPNFMIPPPTHLLPNYTLAFRFASEAISHAIPGIDGDLPTAEELAAGCIPNPKNLLKHATYGA